MCVVGVSGLMSAGIVRPHDGFVCDHVLRSGRLVVSLQTDLADLRVLQDVDRRFEPAWGVVTQPVVFKAKDVAGSLRQRQSAEALRRLPDRQKLVRSNFTFVPVVTVEDACACSVAEVVEHNS